MPLITIKTPPYSMEEVIKFGGINNIKVYPYNKELGTLLKQSHNSIVARWRFCADIQHMVIDCFCSSEDIAILVALNFGKKG